MKKLITLITLILLLLPLCSYSFNYSSYKSDTLDNIVHRSNEILNLHGDDKGVEIITPAKKVQLNEVIVKMPYKCNKGALIRFMKMTGFKVDSSTPINYCVDIKSESGVVVTFHIQDVLVKYIVKEVAVGQHLKLWALWIYSSGFSKLPVLLVNEFNVVQPSN